MTKAEKEAKKAAEQAAKDEAARLAAEQSTNQPPANPPSGDANNVIPPGEASQQPGSTIDEVVDTIVERDERGVPYQIDCPATGGKCVPIYKITNLDGSTRFACAQCSGSGSDRLNIVKL